MSASSPLSHRLLHVAASTCGPSAELPSIAQGVLAAYAETRFDPPVDTFDLWDVRLPAIGPSATATAKMAVFAGLDPPGEQVRP